MKITLHPNNTISINGQHRLYVSQELGGTQVRDLVTRKPVQMPHNRYSLACDYPASGVPDRAQFEADLAEVLA